jgi:hypothetical protein
MPFDTRCLRCDFPLRVSDHTRGQRVRCPACGRPFTAAPLAEQAAAEEARLRAAPAPSQAVAAVAPPAPGVVASPPAPARARPVRAPSAGPAVLALVSQLNLAGAAAFCLGSVALLLASFPTLDLASKPLSAAGLLVAAAAVYATLDRPWGLERAVPCVAAGLSLLVLLLAGPWPWQGRRPAEERPDPAEVLVIPFGDQGMRRRSALEPGAWFPADKGELQQQGVRVRVAGVRLGPALLARGGKQVPSAGPVLAVSLRVANASLDRRVQFRGWAAPAGPDGEAVRLSVGAGPACAAARFPDGWAPQGPAEHGLLPPGGARQETLWFEPPTAGGALRLELPAAAFEGAGVLRFLIDPEQVKRF